MIDGDSDVARLCAAGMAVDGDASAATALFQQAWDARRDDYEASIAAHFMARHQSPNDSLYWNQLAVAHAEAVSDERAKPLLASLYLNLADSYLTLDDLIKATSVCEKGLDALKFLPADGYRDFVSYGLQRLRARISEALCHSQ